MSEQIGLQKAGDFKIDSAKIITSAGTEIDISASIIIITFFEDTGVTALSGNILMFDTVNLASIGPLIGQEYLKLKIRTPTFKDESAIINFTENVFLIHSIQSREKVGNRGQGYLLNFISSEVVKNQRTKVSQTLRGSYSEIVKNMLIDYLNSKKALHIERTSGIKKIISPNVRPFDVITMAMKEAISTHGKDPTYLFFETFRGYHFRSLASMYVQKPLFTYTTYVPGSLWGMDRPGLIDIMKDLQNVIGYEIVSNSDTVVNYRTGVFASKLITHDIFSKEYTTHTYNYLDNFNKESHINSAAGPAGKNYPIYSAAPVEKGGKRVSDFPARTFVSPTSLKNGTDSTHITSLNTYPYAAANPHRWLQRRTSQLIQLEQGILINILVLGNTMLNSGDVVILNIPYTGTKTKENEKHDRFFKGLFFVKRIRHDFDVSAGNKHTMRMMLVKDSVEDRLSDLGPFEPKSKKGPFLYEDFY